MSAFKVKTRILIPFLALFVLASCKYIIPDNDSDSAASSDKSISSFKFMASNNAAFSSDVVGTVYENSHTVGIAVATGTDVTVLKPTVQIDGESVSPASGVTQDFTNPVSYTVSAADGTTQDFEATVTVTSDADAPTSPSILVNGGDASTTSTSVTLSLSASDNEGVVAYYASESSTMPSVGDAGWVSVTSDTSYSGSGAFTLSSGTAIKTVFVWFRDVAGNISASDSDSIEYADVSSGLIAYFPFNGNVTDESGNGNNGTINGAILSTDKDGNTDKAYSFDGVDDNISLSNAKIFGSNSNRSVSVWVYANSTAGNPYLVHNIDNTEGQWALTINSGNFRCRGYEGGTWGEAIFSATALAWQHVVCQYDGTKMQLYINGVLKNEAATNLAANSIDIKPYKFGSDVNGSSNFGGKIDNLRIYNRALSVSEIQALYDE